MTLNINENITPRERVASKLSMAEAGHEVTFGPLEAKIAGIFVEDAITLEDIDDGVEQIEG